MTDSSSPSNPTHLQLVSGNQNLEKESEKMPVCVDLDGTIIRGDLFIESLFNYVLSNPLRIFSVLFWTIYGGRPRLKQELSKHVAINVASLNYNRGVIDYLQDLKKSGFTLLLVSGSDQKYVSLVADHIGIFEEAIGSDGKTNYTGGGKARLLLERYGEKKFCYIGNSNPDLKVWKYAQKAVVVSHNNTLVKKTEDLCDDVEVIEPDVRQDLSSLPKLIRVHQWSKNLLIFFPLFLAHQWHDPARIFYAFLAFIGFSATASTIYICNDLLDLESDRLHIWKRRRPLAAGSFNEYYLFWLIPLLLCIAASVSLFLPVGYILTLLCYIVITLSYSAKLKEVPILDVITLAVLYTLRLLAGAAATSVAISSWLLLFSLFLFLSLSLIKRYAELLEVKNSKRGYVQSDLPLISAAGIASGYICSLVAILYAASPEVTMLYSAPKLLWPVGILIVYWVTRMWLLTLRGEIQEDPVVFTLKDKPSYLVGFLCVVLVILAANI